MGLASAGADIILVQRNLDDTRTKDAVEAQGVKCTQILCDLAFPDDVKVLISKVLERSNIDIVLNCGGERYCCWQFRRAETELYARCKGTQKRSPAAEFPDADWDTVMQINLNAVWQITRDAGRHMLERQKSGRTKYRGKIINIASLLSFQGGFTVPAYAAAKHGVLGIVGLS